VSTEQAPRIDIRVVPAALACWLVTALGILLPVGMAPVAAFVIAGVLAMLVRDRLASVSAVLAVCAVGAGFGCAIALRAGDVARHPLATRLGDVVDVTVTPSESPRAIGHGRMWFSANLQRLGEDRSGGRVTVFVPALDFAEAAPGRPVRFRARVTKPHRRDLTVATLTATGRPTFGGAPLIQRAAQAVRQRFAAAARESLPAPSAAILPGLVLGDMTAVSDTTVAEFKTAGLTHLTAVSGANVTIVCGAVLAAAALIGPRAAVCLAALALGAFVVVVQPSPSVLRAAVMGAVTLLGILTARRKQAIPALAGTVLVLLAVAPQLAVDVGFALSVSATAALVLLAPPWSRRLTERGWPKPVADALCVAAAAQLVSAPLIAAISGQFSVVSVLANILVAPAIVPVTVLGTAAAALATCWPAAAEFLIRFTGPELWWLLSVAHGAHRLPGATLAVPSGAFGAMVIAVASLACVLLPVAVVAVVARRRRGRGAPAAHTVGGT